MNKQESIGLAIIAVVVLIFWWLSQNALSFLHQGNAGTGLISGYPIAPSNAMTSGACHTC